MFEELFSLIGQFEKHGRLREAHDLYVCLIDHFPNVSELKKCALQLAISQLRTAKHLCTVWRDNAKWQEILKVKIGARKCSLIFVPCLMIGALYRTVLPNSPYMLCDLD